MAIKRADLGQIIPTITVSPAVQLLDPESNATIDIDKSADGLDQTLTFKLPRGEKGEQGIQGIQGEKGDRGDPFKIVKTYPTINDMYADADNPDVTIGSFVMIAGVLQENGQYDMSDADIGKLYCRIEPADGDTAATSKFSFITDLSGAQGIKGDPGKDGKDGEKGDPGEDGKTYKYSFGVSDGHLYAFFDDEGRDPNSSTSGMPWQPWTNTTIL